MKSFFDFIVRTEATRGVREPRLDNRKAEAPWSAPTSVGVLEKRCRHIQLHER
ncbi:hypothetical protein LC048_13205 [Mesobacillus subterraneus]|uniref:hypothetical protein n=1 Tax=Mesobacillus subterraneus TaxID=285983 RepID=UPI00273FCBB9|nr:hypothetical protein [Mesobacillus subterraneus]WLR53486.1 hypothetical protein LC048_13205 [Mesobacillus subterraneus]